METSKCEDTEDESILEVSEFDWATYLDNCNNVEASPESAFCHVEASLDTGVKEGMIVEKPLDSTNQTFWLASIDSVFGPLLKLTWLGDEQLVEIWHDLNKEHLFPLGYCQMNKKKMKPPAKIAEMCPLWQTLSIQYLEDPTFDTVSMHFLDDDGITPIERIRSGMGVHVEDLKKSYDAKILSNYGGLLHLQNREKIEEDDLIFYNSPKISQILQKSNCTGLTKPPSDLIKQQYQLNYDFVKNEDVEVLIDGNAHIGTVLEDGLLKLKVDKDTVITSPHYSLCPLGTFLDFSQTNAQNQTAPKEKFHKLTNAEELGFDIGQKLMILIRKREFHPCTVIKLIDHFLTLKIDTLDGKEYICSAHDPIIFPLSWPQTQGLKFFIRKSILKDMPILAKDKPLDEDLVQKESSVVEKNDSIEEGSSWCQPVYFNYKCYSASFLSRARLAGLPKKVGPGPVKLVMREVLNLIIGSSFKSGSVLKRLEAKSDQPATSDFVIEELKGKSRVLNLKGRIEIPTKVHQVDKYLRETCQKLSACPNLVSTVVYEGICPADCHNRPKADFKDDEPSQQNTNVRTERVPKRKAKKRKHPDTLLIENSKRVATSESDESETSTSRPSSPCQQRTERKKRSKEWGTILPKSEIRTRGAKLPNFSLHLKIRPSRKDQRAIESSNLRMGSYGSACSAADALLTKSGGKKGRRELPPAFNIKDFPKAPPPIRRLRLENNPEHWTPHDTANFLAGTPDCAHLARFAVEDDIDGPAFMLLNYPTVKEYWKLKTNTAISLCRHIESVVLAHRLLGSS